MENFFIELFTTIHGWVTIIFGLISWYIPAIHLRKRDSDFRQNTAVSLGILGTFLGIVIGLIFFDFNNMESSINVLLNGLKTAFITPVIGLATALWIKINTKEEAVDNATIETVLYELNQNIKENSEQIKSLKNGIVGDGETSLSTQIQKLRVGMLDKQEELNSEFKNFAKQMAENNSKALIGALEEVMREFNTKISAQFGENFKHLNEGVGKMLEWQENNKENMDNVISVLENTKESIKSYSDGLLQIGKSVEKISLDLEKTSTSSKSMVDFAESSKTVLNKFNAEFSEFEGISEKAKDTFDKSILSFDGMKTIYEKAIERMNKEYEGYVKQITEKEKEMDTSLTRAVKIMSEAAQKNNEIVKNSIIGMEKEISERMTSFRNQFEILNRDTKKFLQDSVLEVDTNLKNTVNKLGNHISSIAEHVLEKIK